MKLSLVVFPLVVLGLQSGGTVAGVVKKASGERVAGAMVKARNSGVGVIFTMISQEQEG